MIRTNNTNINTGEYWDKRYSDRKGYERETGLTRFNKALEYIKDGDRVLDIGCGIGTFCEMVYNKYPHNIIYGTDISSQVIEDNLKANPAILYFNRTVGNQKLPCYYLFHVRLSETNLNRALCGIFIRLIMLSGKLFREGSDI